MIAPLRQARRQAGHIARMPLQAILRPSFPPRGRTCVPALECPLMKACTRQDDSRPTPSRDAAHGISWFALGGASHSAQNPQESQGLHANWSCGCKRCAEVRLRGACDARSEGAGRHCCELVFPRELRCWSKNRTISTVERIRFGILRHPCPSSGKRMYSTGDVGGLEMLDDLLRLHHRHVRIVGAVLHHHHRT